MNYRLPPLGNVRQVSQYLAVSEMELKEFETAEGFPKAINFAGGRRWRFDDIDKWLESQAGQA